MLSTNPDRSIDVLVVGAGPVGLTMAAELARHGATCRIVEKLSEPSPYCRAIGVSPRTLEVWDDMGIARAMIDAGLWLTGRRTYLKDGNFVESISDFSALPYGTLGIPQPETERILTAHLASFGIAVERGVSLTSLEQSADAAHVNLLHPDQNIEQAAFRYVIGCDGSRSAVRQQLGIAFEGDRFPMGFMLGDVILESDAPRAMSLWAVDAQPGQPPDFFAAIPLPERNRYRVSMVAPPNPDPAQPEITESGAGQEHGILANSTGPSLAELQVVATRLMPSVTLSDLRWSSFFRIGMRLAASYRKGNAFLAGDAAHIHPPIGGQGMNTGIQDAYSLAWKLALVLRGKASPALLDTYDAERRAVGADVIARTVESSRQFGRKPATKEERLADTQIFIHYRDSVLSREEAGDAESPVRAGDRAPDCGGLRRDQVRAPFRLFDAMRGAEHLLVMYAGVHFDREHVNLMEELADTLASAPIPPTRLLAIAAAGCTVPEMIGVPTATDANGEFAEAYVPAAGTAYLIRPDGYIAYHARPLTRQGLLDYFKTLYSIVLASDASIP